MKWDVELWLHIPFHSSIQQREMKYDHARLLLVDDEPSHRLILKELIQELWTFPVDIMEAEAGQEAILMYQ